jgi:hypothetical protein
MFVKSKLKRALALSFSVCMLAMCVGCGNVDKAQALIDELPSEYSESVESQLNEAIDFYNTLSDEEKEKVNSEKIDTLQSDKISQEVTQYIAEGNYADAYNITEDEEQKKSIYIENIVAHVACDVPSGLKNPSSFELNYAWYDEESNIVILDVQGTNSYGGSVGSYYYYKWYDDDEDFLLYVSLSSLEEEEYSSYDDTSDKLEKLLKNAARGVVSDIINDKDLKLDKSSVENINQLFEEDLLEDIPLPENYVPTPTSDDTDDSSTGEDL